MAKATENTEATESENAAPPEPSAGEDVVVTPPAEGAPPINPVTNQPLASFFAPKGHDARAELIASQASGMPAANVQQLIDDSVAASDRDTERINEANENLKALKKANSETMKASGSFVTPDQYLAMKQAEVHAEAATLTTHTIRPGGDFMVNGVRVDANGVEIK